ncbi:EamA family transporter RarD [Humisphaera borealis]|uniref:EamA family transporter RarD n=1 Tax=Humisphaera borealis TaxID=2807512 RepID=A0A7M2WT34_9BACT|nr:EamA family transporter RarD [Humisphaera borealis]QOV88668.1 EamA family transporter RarD [Humisphaera borealis]
MTASPSRPSSAVGLIYAMAAYLSWGFITLYFAALKAVPPILVLAHRIVWSVVFLTVLLIVFKQGPDFRRAVRNGRLRWAMLGSTVMIAINWYTFIWAVTNRQTVEASFGYFINPLVNVLLGVIVLKERLRLMQWIAIGFAVAGVAVMGWYRGGLPTVSLILASSFGLYGLIRKTASVGPLVGLSIETAILCPIAIGFVAVSTFDGRPMFHWGPLVGVLLMLGGIVTALPLIWFAAAARRLRLATMGFLQYTAPTCQLLIAVLVLGEAFTIWHGRSFGLIWIGLAIYSVDAALAFGRWRSDNAAADKAAAVTASAGSTPTPTGNDAEPVAVPECQA